MPTKRLPTAYEQATAKNELERISIALRTFPREDVDTNKTAAAFNMCSRDRTRDRVGLMALLDGVAVIYTTEAFLESQSHRFIFPDNDEPRYHREPFNIDCQAVGTQPINLHGTAAL